MSLRPIRPPEIELAQPARLQVRHLAGGQVPEALMQLRRQMRAREAIRVRLLPGRPQLLRLPARHLLSNGWPRSCVSGLIGRLTKGGCLHASLGERRFDACVISETEHAMQDARLVYAQRPYVFLV